MVGGRQEAELFLVAKSKSASVLSVGFQGTQLGLQLCSGLGLRSEQKELEPLVQLWAAVIRRERKRRSLLWSSLKARALTSPLGVHFTFQ